VGDAHFSVLKPQMSFEPKEILSLLTLQVKVFLPDPGLSTGS